MHGLSEQDLDVQARARPFADELIPLRGRGRAERAASSTRRCVDEHAAPGSIELGLCADEHPDRARRPRLHYAPAGARPGAGRPGHQRARLGRAHPAAVVHRGRDADAARALAGSRPCAASAHECYAITEEGAGSDVDAIAATARRDGDDYVLDGVKWHVTSYNDADYCFFQAKLTDGAARRRARDVRRRPALARASASCAPRRTRTRSPPPPDRRVRGRAGARPTTSSAREGDGMTFAYEWFRYERLMIAARCLGAAERLVEEATAFAQRAGRRRPSRSSSCQLVAGDARRLR